MISALPLRADIAQRSRHVRFVPMGDMRARTRSQSMTSWLLLVAIRREFPIRDQPGVNSPRKMADHSRDLISVRCPRPSKSICTRRRLYSLWTFELIWIFATPRAFTKELLLGLVSRGRLGTSDIKNRFLRRQTEDKWQTVLRRPITIPGRFYSFPSSKDNSRRLLRASIALVLLDNKGSQSM
jgi:hypothetical protein